MIRAWQPTDLLDTAQQFELLEGKLGCSLTIGLFTNDERRHAGFGNHGLDNTAGAVAR